MDRKTYNAMTIRERAEYLAATYDLKELLRRYNILAAYQGDLFRINEQSFEAQREEDKVFKSLMVFSAAMKIAKEKKKENDDIHPRS